jgi:hypothetical protein
MGKSKMKIFMIYGSILTVLIVLIFTFYNNPIRKNHETIESPKVIDELVVSPTLFPLN